MGTMMWGGCARGATCITHLSLCAHARRCLPELCHPSLGPLNLATMLPKYTVRPDLGPKGYVACGRWAAGAVGAVLRAGRKRARAQC